MLRTEEMILNLGPSHPAMHGAFRVVLTISGERIVRAEPDIGFLHRGNEKLAEYRPYPQFIVLTDRFNYMSPLMNNFGYCQAMEDLIGIEVPERCQVIRVIFSELSRIGDHLVNIGISAFDLAAASTFLYTFQQREKIYDIIEDTTGARMTPSYGRIGGLANDVDSEFEAKTRHFIDQLPPVLDEIESLLSRNKIWLKRTRGVGTISEERAVAYGFTGPCLRASGKGWDLRKVRPYWGYEEYQFDIPTGECGDTYDRYKVRLGEMRESVRIIRQALDRFPRGPIDADAPDVVLPPKDEVYENIEGLMRHFKLIMHGIKNEPSEIYSATEAANGELGFYIVSDGTKFPYRLHVRAPCFKIYSAFAELIEGAMIPDAVAILGSLNIIAGELDR